MVRSLPTATLLAAFLLAASAQAADAAAPPRPTAGAADRARAAASVLHAIDVDSSVRPMALRMAGFIAEQVAQWQVTPEQQPQVNAALTKIQDLLIVELSWPSVAKDYIGVYSETFSTVQLQEIAAFFATPTGRKYIATVPALQEQALVIGEQHLAAVQPQIQLILEDLQRHLLATMPPAPKTGSVETRPATDVPATARVDAMLDAEGGGRSR